MQQSGAIGILVLQDRSSSPQDMNCFEDECSNPLDIPASMIPNIPKLTELAAQNDSIIFLI